MRILFVIYDHPFAGQSGVSMYCRDLFPALVEQSVEVGVICIQHRDWRFRPYLRTVRERGITLFKLVNSPLYPEDSLYRPEQDSHQLAIEELFRSTLQQFRPDILHIQTFHGYPASILAVAKEVEVATVVTLHDFWAICPQGFLVRTTDEACDGPDEGRNCMRFCVRPRPLQQRVYQWGMRLPEGFFRDAFVLARDIYRRHSRAQTSMWTPNPHRRGRLDQGLLKQHALRATFTLEALRNADQLLAVSDFVKSVFIRHGITVAKISTLPPTLGLNGITWKSRSTPSPQIRFGFLGRAVPLKGVHIFAEAAGGLPKNRARFLVFGPASHESQRFLQGLTGDRRLEFQGPYARSELPRVLEQVDVVVVPSVAQETVALVTLEAYAAGVPVIGSRIGAIPEYVCDGETGFLFTPGDSQDLRTKMQRMIENPSLVAEMSARTRPPEAIRRHVDALLAVYTATIEKGRRTA